MKEIRNGPWFGEPIAVRSAYRDRDDPDDPDDARGFRLLFHPQLQQENIMSLAPRTFNINGVNFTMLPTPEGEHTYTMGSPPDEPNRFSDEDQVEVTIREPFWAGETHVTQALYEAVTGTNPSFFKGNPDFPVESVTWHDAVACAEKLTEIARATGQIGPDEYFDLPEAHELEYIIRAGTTTAYPWGDTITPEQARYNSDSPVSEYDDNYPTNNWGFRHAVGNVWSWTKTDYVAQRPAKIG